MKQDIDPHENEKKDHKFCCYCGREFKSFRGLNTHKRSCFVEKTPNIAKLFEDVVEEINNIPRDDNENNLIDLIDLAKGKIKKGVFVLNSVQDWESANEFFRMSIYHEDVNSEIRDLICNYFSKTHGPAREGKKNPFNTNYRVMSKYVLKRQLKTLKKANSTA